MARHAHITLATGLDIYFCDPHSPWQRGSNENTNGLLRQYFPKGTVLSSHSRTHLDHIAAKLNRSPRQTLGLRTPAEALNDLLLNPPDTSSVATTPCLGRPLGADRSRLTPDEKELSGQAVFGARHHESSPSFRRTSAPSAKCPSDEDVALLHLKLVRPMPAAGVYQVSPGWLRQYSWPYRPAVRTVTMDRAAAMSRPGWDLIQAGERDEGIRARRSVIRQPNGIGAGRAGPGRGRGGASACGG